MYTCIDFNVLSLRVINAFPSFDKVLLHTPFATVKLESDGWLVNWPLAVGLVGHR